MFARGFKFTEAGKKYPYPSHKILLARRMNTSLTSGDLSKYRGPQIRQKDEGECTGASARRVMQLFHACRNLLVEEISDQALYTLGREEEWAGTNPDNVPPLADTGADPALVMKAARDVGLVLAKDWPGPGDPGHQVSLRNTEPSDAVLVPAFDRRGLAFHQVIWQPGKLRETILALHQAGYPCSGAFCADGIAPPGGTDPGNTVVRSLPPASQADHMVAFLDVTDPNVALVDNWWDDPADPDPALRIAWGDPSSDPRYDGTWRLDWAAADKGFALVLALDYLPTF